MHSSTKNLVTILLLVATLCGLVYHINIAHLPDCPHVGVQWQQEVTNNTYKTKEGLYSKICDSICLVLNHCYKIQQQNMAEYKFIPQCCFNFIVIMSLNIHIYNYIGVLKRRWQMLWCQEHHLDFNISRYRRVRTRARKHTHCTWVPFRWHQGLYASIPEIGVKCF
jgi:hypothetical protein